MARPRKADPKPAQSYRYPEADLAARPEIGAQAHFKQAKPPATYRFDSSLAPELQWDGQNPARETAEHLIKEIANCGPRLADLAIEAPSSKRDQEITNRKSQIANLQSRLRGISGPFLNWSGKAERLSFDVPTLPLFIHERLSTKAILETLKGHKRDKQDDFLDALYGFQERPLADQLLRAYEYRDNWVNRLMLGDSMVVMNSLLRYESLGGQVQMIYMDPPYGVKFGSNFQPFVRKRDVSHNDDADLTREPEMVQAYRDTWELGLHSYLTYLRDRLLLARELLAPSGSIFVQISDENLHHVREVMDEVFGAENFVCVITFAKTSSATADLLPAISDYLIWYARDRDRAMYHSIYSAKEYGGEGTTSYTLVELADGSRRAMSAEERNDPSTLPQGSRIYCLDTLTSSRPPGDFPVEFGGTSYRPRRGYWKTGLEGFEALKQQGRLVAKGGSIFYKRFFTDFPFIPLSHLWADTMLGGFAKSEEKLYVVQTSLKVIQRCLLMTTDPGDLVLDPTCGSGTTAYVAEQWGRRWITCDTSRVPLALARQRLLTATFDYYELKDEARGPAGGFVYRRKQNQKGEEVGGIVPHITLKSIANNEPPAEEVLVDRPELVRNVVRVTGPFSFEATIPMAEGLDTQPETPGIQGAQHETYVQRMIEVLRKAPVLRLPGNQTVTLKNIRPPAKTLALSAEALVDSSRTPALTPALSPRERENLSASPDKPKRANITPTREATPPLPAGEGRGEGERCALSETSGSSSQPVAILFGPENGPLSERLVREAWDEAGLKHYSHLYVIGFAIDPKARQFIDSAGKIGVGCTYLQATMDLQMGDLLKNMRSSQIFSVCGLPDVPAWFLDTDYNGMVFRVRQAFFPRTGAWENLKKALRVEFEETVWDHLAGTTSAPFPEGEHGQVAVKVIDPRGNELLVVRKLEEAK